MSTTAEDVSATLAGQTVSLESKADSIADLLLGDDESKTEEELGEETQTQTSKQDEDEDSTEESEANDDDEETTLELVADDEPTWESTLGVSDGDLSFDEEGNVNGFNTKVNGELETVGAKDLIAGYQNNKANTAKAQAHADLVKDFEVQQGAMKEEYSSKLESVDALTKHFERQLIAEYDKVNWDQLRVEDPAEYAAARHDYATKAGELNKIMTAISTDREAASQETAEANQTANNTYRKAQYDAMLINNPTWSDQKVLEAAQTEHKSFVQEKYGFGDAEWAMVNDARLIELIKDAKKYHDGASIAAKKTNKPVPKFQKSRGRGQKKPVSKLSKLTAASQKATGSNRRDLQQSAVAELLLGGT